MQSATSYHFPLAPKISISYIYQLIQTKHHPMSSSPPQALSAPAAELLAAELLALVGAVMENLKTLIATRFLRIPHLYPLITPLWKRLNRIHRRLKRALELGTTPPRPHASRAGQPPRKRATTTPALPQTFGWLIWALGWQAAGYAGHLEHIFRRPEIRALVAACPRAQRVLRPITSMLALKILEPEKPKPTRPENHPTPAPDPTIALDQAAPTATKIEKPA